MGLNWKQFELNVLRPVLDKLQPCMPSNAMVYKGIGETLWHESGDLTYLGQVPRSGYDPGEQDGIGFGNGIASIEEETWDWMLSWLDRTDQPHLAVISEAVGFTLQPHHYNRLDGNLYLNVAMCRLRYWLAPPPWPALTGNIDRDIWLRAGYWQRHYNGGSVDRRSRYFADAERIPWEVLWNKIN